MKSEIIKNIITPTEIVTREELLKMASLAVTAPIADIFSDLNNIKSLEDIDPEWRWCISKITHNKSLNPLTGAVTLTTNVEMRDPKPYIALLAKYHKIGEVSGDAEAEVEI